MKSTYLLSLGSTLQVKMSEVGDKMWKGCVCKNWEVIKKVENIVE